MSRRLHPCRTCKPEDAGTGRFALRRGFTRHTDRICAACRRHGPPDPYPGKWKARAA